MGSARSNRALESAEARKSRRCPADQHYSFQVRKDSTMRNRKIGQFVISGLLAGLVALACPSRGWATPIILDGWDLLKTVPSGTVFGGDHWHGVPLGTFDFGGAIGVKNVGGVDTIIQRLMDSTGNPAIIPIDIVALQLQSVEHPDMFVTLADDQTPDNDIMEVTVGPEGDPHGTFDSFFDVYFDVRVGGLDGQIVQSGVLAFTSSGNPWRHQAVLGGVVIDGVNHNLNGTDDSNDFWPTGDLVHDASGAAHHTVRASVPDGGATLPLSLISMAVLGFSRLRIRRSRHDS
jgi:hypothetical protein